jgi:hypothetical protein
MATLSGSTIASTYDRLLALPSGGLNGTTLVAITDGNASATCALQVATTKINIKPASATVKVFEVQESDATPMLSVDETATTTKGVVVNETGQADIDFRVEASSITHALFVDGTQGNVGIGGVTSPSNWTGAPELVLEGTQPLIHLNDTSGDSWAIITDASHLRFYNDTDSRADISIDGTGNVGIGTAGPSAQLHVLNDAATEQMRIESSNSTSTKLYIRNDDTGDAGDSMIYFGVNSQDWSIGIDNSLSDSFVISEAATLSGSPKLVIDVAGKVGIGTNSPATVQGKTMGSTILLLNIDNGTTAGARLTARGADASLDLIDSGSSTDYKWFTLYSSDKFTYFRTMNDDGDSVTNTIMTLDMTNQRVGIGTEIPLSILDVQTVAGTTVLIQTTAQTDTNYARIQCKSVQASTSNTVYAEIGNYQSASTDTDGPVGYLRLMPSDRAISAYLWVEDDDTLKGSSDINHLGTTNGVEFGAAVTSDERLKDIDSSPFPYGLSDINKLTPIKFQFNNRKNKVDKLGFGAQSVRDIISEPVKDTKICIDGYTETNEEDLDNRNGDKVTQVPNSTGKEGKLTLEYHQLIPVLVKAVQELTAKVEALENNNKQGDSSNEQDQEQSAGSGDSGGDASSESSGEDSGGVEGSSSDSSDADDSGADSSESGSDSSSDSSVEGSEDAGSSGSDASADSEDRSGEDDSEGAGEPSDEWTKDQLKVYMDSNSIEYNSGDTKQDLLDKITLAGEGPDEG